MSEFVRGASAPVGISRLARLLSPLLLALAGTAAWADCQMEPMTIPVHIVGRRPVATVTLNGQPVEMLVDSGAFQSFLPESTAKELQLKLRMMPFGSHVSGYTGGIEAQLTRVAKVGFGSAELKNVEFIVAGNELGYGIKGILGRDILALGDTEYDLAHGVVRLVFPRGDCGKVSMAYWAGDAPVIVTRLAASADTREDGIYVDVDVNGVSVRAMMDTGAASTAMTLAAARKAGVKEENLKPFGRTGGAGEERVRTWLADIDSFQLGGERITHQRLRVDDTSGLEQGMLIGLDYFLAHRIYVSLLQGKIYATWNGGAVFDQVPGAAANDFDKRYAAAPAEVAADDAVGLLRRGTAFAAARNYKRALEDLNRACQLAPTESACFLARGRVHDSLREDRLALADLDEALRLTPSLVEARMLRAPIRRDVGDRAGALADMTMLDETLPPSAPQREQIGQMYADLSMLPEALRQWDLWLTNHENDGAQAHVYNQRSWLRVRLGVDLPAALADARKAVDKDAGEGTYRDTLGWVYLRMGDAPRAKAAFDASLGMRPSAAWSLYGRALTALQLKDEASAQRDLQAARKLRPSIDKEVREEGFEVPEAVRAGSV